VKTNTLYLLHYVNPSHLAVTAVQTDWCYWSGEIIYRAIIYTAVRACALVCFWALLPADTWRIKILVTLGASVAETVSRTKKSIRGGTPLALHLIDGW